MPSERIHAIEHIQGLFRNLAIDKKNGWNIDDWDARNGDNFLVLFDSA
jgi:hypothetical protein